MGGQLALRLRQCGFYPVLVGREFEQERLFREREDSLVTWSQLCKAGRLPKGTVAVVNLAGTNISLKFQT